ncbi:monooxygenase family protein [Methylorubrum populi]
MTALDRQAANGSRPRRESVDLSDHPDLVVVYLGFRVGRLQGLKALLGIGRGLARMQREKPDGLLAHENLVYGLTHVGMRQYWRDLESLEAFTRSDPHKIWWRDFGRDPAGNGFWHEAYRLSGGMEAIYVGMPRRIGLASFAAARDPQGPFMTSRQRLAA